MTHGPWPMAYARMAAWRTWPHGAPGRITACRWSMACSPGPMAHGDVKGAQKFTGHSQYGTCVMQVWLAATCPKTLIVTLRDELESGNAKNRVNLARFLCDRCGVLYILRVVYTYAYAVRCAGGHALKCESNHSCKHGPLDSLRARQCRKPCVNILF